MRAMLHYDVRGDGATTVLLVHGFLGSGRNLNSLARKWAQADASLRFVLVDMLGHGDSPPLPPGATLETMAEPLLELAVHLHARHIVGHSMGGRVALATRRLPGPKLPVTLLDIGPGATAGVDGGLQGVAEAFVAAPDIAANREEMADWLRARDIPEALVQWLLLNLSRGPSGVAWKQDRRALAALHEATRLETLWDTLTAAPTRCIRGERSGFVSDDDAERMQGLGVSVTTLPGAGHFLHVDQLNALVEQLQGELDV